MLDRSDVLRVLCVMDELPRHDGDGTPGGMGGLAGRQSAEQAVQMVQLE